MESQSFYQRFSGDFIVILDSGLFHKIVNVLVLLENELIEDATSLIFSKLPVIPFGMIYLKASPSIILKRILGRETAKSKYLQEFKDIKEDQIYNRILIEEKINRKGVDILRKRGVKIVEVDSSENINLQLKTIITFFDTLNPGDINTGSQRELAFTHKPLYNKPVL
jgi:thymidylate kinase